VKALALFDFDGTISDFDSATLFYRSLYSNRIVFLYRHLFLCLPQIAAYRCSLTNYLPLKRKRLQIHIGVLSDDNFNKHLLKFQQIYLRSIIKESAIERIYWHSDQGHDVWVVSASYDFLLSDWCRRLNIGLIVNRTVKNQNSCIFEGEDCNFSNKVVQIKKRINLRQYDKVYAYGDSDGDKDMLNLAHESHLNYFE
jgi:HAD superfamily hydrolase (TIGR01490 family)